MGLFNIHSWEDEDPKYYLALRNKKYKELEKENKNLYKTLDFVLSQLSDNQKEIILNKIKEI